MQVTDGARATLRRAAAPDDDDVTSRRGLAIMLAKQEAAAERQLRRDLRNVCGACRQVRAVTGACGCP